MGMILFIFHNQLRHLSVPHIHGAMSSFLTCSNYAKIKKDAYVKTLNALIWASFIVVQCVVDGKYRNL